MIDEEKIKEGIKLLLEGIGEDADRELPEMEEYKAIPSWDEDEQAREVGLAKFDILWNTMLPTGDGLAKLSDYPKQ